MADEDEFENEGEATGAQNWRKQVEAERDAEKVRAETLARENAFLKAGLDLKDPKIQDFQTAYSGELTEEAILAAARERGYLAEEPPPGETTEPATPGLIIPGQEQAATNERRDLQTGATAPGDMTAAHPHDIARKAHEDAINTGATEERALAAAINTRFEAAQAGDTRVLLAEDD